MQIRKTKAFVAAKKKAVVKAKTYSPQIISASNLQTGTFYNSIKKLKGLINHSINA
ncbi:MAG: hypothetical protein LBB73_08220 [Dysgonamonadaceae bacterium]|nr:hypothetical protein [Dysgonamonadaceae bacterium]